MILIRRKTFVTSVFFLVCSFVVNNELFDVRNVDAGSRTEHAKVVKHLYFVYYCSQLLRVPDPVEKGSAVTSFRCSTKVLFVVYILRM